MSTTRDSVVKLRQDKPGYTLQAIADEVGRSRERVRQILTSENLSTRGVSYDAFILGKLKEAGISDSDIHLLLRECHCLIEAFSLSIGGSEAEIDAEKELTNGSGLSWEMLTFFLFFDFSKNNPDFLRFLLNESYGVSSFISQRLGVASAASSKEEGKINE